ncbi:RING finger protein 141-like [Chenopodium quinoa]|uniref:RING-type domain-containing protein n=1 Tax=Chenopodium quinoa TaxID=63459 RepID=A0A803LXC1_CHEQI|nr:RING finger protein 141-like [Chenopodium quinoa]XP_021715521.1 RING finger protein 141-like [Chenopodium quinoa]
MKMKKSFRESVKALEADIQHANTLASGYRRQPDGACFQMRLSYGPAAHLFLFLVQWTDCYLAGALGLLRILIFMTYEDGETTMSVHEKKASIRQFYGVIFPSLLQLEKGITELDDRKQKEVCAQKYRRADTCEKPESMELEDELEAECGICMENNDKGVLPNCNHSLCFKCYKDWSIRSQSCPFCRDCLRGVKSGDLWIFIGDRDVVDLSVIMRENLNRLFIYLDKLPLVDPYPGSTSYDWHI